MGERKRKKKHVGGKKEKKKNSCVCPPVLNSRPSIQYTNAPKLTHKSTSQLQHSMERLCKCYDGDFWFLLKGNKGKRVGVPSAKLAMLAFTPPPGGGGVTLLYGLYRYVRTQRVWFLSRFGHKLGVDFSHFAAILVINRVSIFSL